MHTEKIALVTGANKGIGYEIARGLGAAGATVLVGSRDAGRGKAAAERLAVEGVAAVTVRLDVTDYASAAAAAAWVDEGYRRLDVLVNNAGILLERGQQPSETPLGLLRATYETNVLGIVAVTNAMLPLLHRSATPRIVNVSSGLGSVTLCASPAEAQSKYPLLAYKSSKSAVSSLTVSYANELRDTPFKVNAADPGYCATDLNGHSGYRTAEQGAEVAVRLAILPADGPSGEFHGEHGPVLW